MSNSVFGTHLMRHTILKVILCWETLWSKKLWMLEENRFSGVREGPCSLLICLLILFRG